MARSPSLKAKPESSDPAPSIPMEAADSALPVFWATFQEELNIGSALTFSFQTLACRLVAWQGRDGDWRIGLGEAWAEETFDVAAAWRLADRARAVATAVTAVGGSSAEWHCMGGIAADPARGGAGWPSARFALPEAELTPGPEGRTRLRVATAARDGETALALSERIQALGAAWRDRLIAVAALSPLPAVASDATPLAGPEAQADWEVMVRAGLAAIHAGALEKIVLARALPYRTARPLHVWPLFSVLAAQAPDTLRFMWSQPTPEGEQGFFGASPERLFGLAGDRLSADCLAGTAVRGADEAEDAELAAALLADPKELHEHALVVSGIRAALAPLSQAIEAPEAPTVRRWATVQHLWTPLTAELTAGCSLEAVLRAMHPTPAVGGWPRDAALRLIAELEPEPRGWYAGAVGWVSPTAAEFAVGIRSAHLAPEGLRVMAGAGIVAGSDPTREWHETARKAAPFVRLLTAAAPEVADEHH